MLFKNLTEIQSQNIYLYCFSDPLLALDLFNCVHDVTLTPLPKTFYPPQTAECSYTYATEYMYFSRLISEHVLLPPK